MGQETGVRRSPSSWGENMEVGGDVCLVHIDVMILGDEKRRSSTRQSDRGIGNLLSDMFLPSNLLFFFHLTFAYFLLRRLFFLSFFCIRHRFIGLAPVDSFLWQGGRCFALHIFGGGEASHLPKRRREKRHRHGQRDTDRHQQSKTRHTDRQTDKQTIDKNGRGLLRVVLLVRRLHRICFVHPSLTAFCPSSDWPSSFFWFFLVVLSFSRSLWRFLDARSLLYPFSKKHMIAQLAYLSKTRIKLYSCVSHALFVYYFSLFSFSFILFTFSCQSQPLSYKNVASMLTCFIDDNIDAVRPE